MFKETGTRISGYFINLLACSIGVGALECCVLLIQVPQDFRGRLARFWCPEPAMIVSKTFCFIPPVNAEVPHDSSGWEKGCKLDD